MTNRTPDVVGAVPSEQLVAERQRKFAAAWPTYAEESSKVPPLLAEEPEFAQLAADRQAVRDAISRANEANDAARKRNAVAQAKYEKGVTWALETNNVLPPPFAEEALPVPHMPLQYWKEKFASIQVAELAVMVDLNDVLTKRLKARAAKTQERVDRAERDLETAKRAHDPYESALLALGAVIESDEDRRAREKREWIEQIPWTDGPTVTTTFEDEDGATVAVSQKMKSTRTKLAGRR